MLIEALTTIPMNVSLIYICYKHTREIKESDKEIITVEIKHVINKQHFSNSEVTKRDRYNLHVEDMIERYMTDIVQTLYTISDFESNRTPADTYSQLQSNSDVSTNQAILDQMNEDVKLMSDNEHGEMRQPKYKY